MKVAAIQFDAAFADVAANLARLEPLVALAAEQRAELALLPEFFTSAIGFSPRMLPVALQGRQVLPWMQRLAKLYQTTVGGSYLLFDGEHAYNTFQLVFPDGTVYSHKKDLPTQLENCYFAPGDENHILHTPLGNIGVALCWEQIRWHTVQRLRGNVDFVLAGSCWWDLPEEAPPDREALRRYNQALAQNAPVELAKLLGVPVVHAAHCGKVRALRFPGGEQEQVRQMVGATQFVDGVGKVTAFRSFASGQGVVVSDLPAGRAAAFSRKEPGQYWIPRLPGDYLDAWARLNPIGRNYYRSTALPYYHKEACAAQFT